MQLETSATETHLSEWCVRVDCQGDTPQQFNVQDIWKIFQGHVGAVTRVSEVLEGGKKWMKVTFRGEDELKKALCMSGYTIGDTCIQVSTSSGRPIFSSKPRVKHLVKSKRQPDTRRNLYVLNVPHDLSGQAYHDLFTPHGAPTHTVLLKTQDSCSRRRGFVVMSTHQEAQNVINWLDGVCIRGFQLRVTWANIDRSNGFMSGYDRATFAGHNGMSLSEPATGSNSSMEPRSVGLGMDTSVIVASNIPMTLFPENDIDILFKPFGLIKNIRVIPPSSSADHPLSTLAPVSPLSQTVIVTYESSQDAIAAKNTLHGQIYEGFALAVGFVSNIGQEDCQAQDSQGSFVLPLSFDLAPSASIRGSTSFDRFGGAQFSAPQEQTLRGLPMPAGTYDTMQLQSMNTFPTRRCNFGNWMSYSPHIPQTLTYQPHPTYGSPSCYSDCT